MRVAVELSGLGPIKQLVQRGVGLSILPPVIVENEVRLGLLHTVEIAHPRLVRAMGLAHRRGEHLTPAAAAMAATIEELASRESAANRHSRRVPYAQLSISVILSVPSTTQAEG